MTCFKCSILFIMHGSNTKYTLMHVIFTPGVAVGLVCVLDIVCVEKELHSGVVNNESAPPQSEMWPKWGTLSFY